MAVWVGVDVGGKRKGFDVAVIDDHRVLVLKGHLDYKQVVEVIMERQPSLVAIDSPRSCAPEGQAVRGCERQLAKLICGIRWTPDEPRVRASAYYAWVLEGAALFAALASHGVHVIEVFPTESPGFGGGSTERMSSHVTQVPIPARTAGARGADGRGDPPELSDRVGRDRCGSGPARGRVSGNGP